MHIQITHTSASAHLHTHKHSHSTYLPVHPDNPPVAFGLVIGTKFLIYVTAIYYGIPTGVIVHWVWLHVLLIVTLTVFYRTTLSDPGHIPKTTNPEQARRVRKQYLTLDICL